MNRHESINKCKLVALAISTFLIMCSPSYATTYYVDKNHPSSGDSNPGTESLPWKIIQKAADTMVAGDTVQIKNGEYNEWVNITTSGTSEKPITYMAYPGHHPIVDGTGVDVPRWKGLFYSGSFSPVTGADYITINGLEIRDTEWYGIRSIYGDHWIIKNCKIHNVGGEYNIDGIHIDKGNDMVILDNEVYGASWNGISAMGCNRCVYDGNYSHDNINHFGMQIIIDNTHGDTDFYYDNVIRNNIVEGNKAGMYFMNNINLTIHHNLIYHNTANDGYSGIHFGEGSGASYSFDSDSKIYNNTIVGHKVSIYNQAFNNLDIYNNIFNNPSSSIFNFHSDADDNHIIDYNNYYGKDYSGKGPNGFFADPLFVDPLNYDFTPQPSSPVCGKNNGGGDVGAVPCEGAPPSTPKDLKIL